MNILVTNDDGIQALGIRNLVEALKNEGNIYVAAPDTQKSASGHSITMGKAISITEVPYKNAELGLRITGTPADCVKLGIRYLHAKGIEIDIVFSGINHGANLGTDTLYSGTVSAAVEGILNDKPSVAVSVNTHHPQHFEYAMELAVLALRNLKDSLSTFRHTAVNINVPNKPKEEIKGVRVTRLGRREYDEWFAPAGVNDVTSATSEYRYRGTPVKYNSKNTEIDVLADQEGYASITPIQADLTAFSFIDRIKKWRIEENE